uniref:G-protein coupled receptors family 3 profile domain-containing protein n=1 Tax=Romanomermis culicivorax TaxID=13658 RepID=A0A915JAT6_ROMCU
MTFHILSLASWTLLLCAGLETVKLLEECSPSEAKPIVKLGPNDAHFIIGWFLNLRENCTVINPKAVEELFAVDWVLSYWNSKTINREKLGVHVYETCSDEKKFLYSMINILHETQFFDQSRCRNVTGRRIIELLDSKRITCGRHGPPGKCSDFRAISISMPSSELCSSQNGFLVPPDIKSAEALLSVLKSTNLPTITYSPFSHLILKEAGIKTFSTVPILENYLELTTGILKSTQCNLVTVFYDSKIISDKILRKIRSHLENAKAKIFQTVTLDDLKLNQKIWHQFSSNRSNVVLCLSDELLANRLTTMCQERGVSKAFLVIPTDPDSYFENKHKILNFDQYPKNPMIIMHHVLSSTFESEYKNYLADQIFKNVTFTRQYLETEFNCEDCAKVSKNEILTKTLNKPLVEPLAMAVYTMGLLSHNRITSLENVGYTFVKGDPTFLQHQMLKFDTVNNVASGMVIRAYKISKTDAGIPFQADVAEYGTNISAPYIYNPRDLFSTVDHKLKIQSSCSYSVAECVTCSKIFELPLKGDVHVQQAADLYLLGLFDLKRWDRPSKSCRYGGQGTMDVRSIINPLAFTYVLETMKRKYADLNILEHVNVATILADTCGSGRNTVELIAQIFNSDCLQGEAEQNGLNITIPTYNIAGVAAGLTESSHLVARQIFATSDARHTNALLIGGTSDQTTPHFNEMNTMPDYEMQGKVLLQLLGNNKWDHVTVVISVTDAQSSKFYNIFKILAKINDVCIGEEVFLLPVEKINATLSKKPSAKVIVMFTSAQDTVYYVQSQQGFPNLIYILVGEAYNFEWHLFNVQDHKQKLDIAKIRYQLLGSLSIQPNLKLDTDIVDFLIKVNPNLLSEPWFLDFWQNYFECTLKNATTTKLFSKICPEHEQRLFPEVFLDSNKNLLNREAFFIHSIESFVFALDATYKRLCPEQIGLCTEFFEQYHEFLNDFARKTTKVDQFAVYQYKRRHVEEMNEYEQIGFWSSAEGLNIREPILWYSGEEKSANFTLPESSCKLPYCRCHLSNDFFSKPIVEDDASSLGASNRHQDFIFSNTVDEVDNPSPAGIFDGLPLRRHAWTSLVWTYGVLVAATLLLMVTLAVLVLVVVKVWNGSIRGNQSLGICLLLGVCQLYVACYFFVFDPSETLCRLRYFGHSLSYCICFGVMIAKACQLRNSEILGANGHISFWNYWLLLFFIVAVQLALNLQWVLAKNPAIKVFTETGSHEREISIKCDWNAPEFVASQAYVLILLILASFLAYISRNVKRNYKETRWLLYTCWFCLPTCFLWSLLYLIMPPEYQDPLIAVHLIIIGTAILCFMFGPKVYILLSYEPILVEVPPMMTTLTTSAANAFHHQRKYQSSLSFEQRIRKLCENECNQTARAWDNLDTEL